MEPLAIATAIVALLIIASRGPLIFAPTATLNVYRRWLSTPGRIRLVGSLAALLAVPLIVTGREAQTQHGGIAIGIEGLGWLMMGAALWLVLAPQHYLRIVYAVFDAVSDPTLLRVVGVFAVAIGLGLGWVAFFVL
ncbi:MAG: hypothetical protein JRH01_23110 [Deltaproteobacteria bacterium]|nr:hypothetical protein [Deltaproteobacteria bacterium]MBW2394456.1 hypothetical protein [Deltaproteobacteria bacterium]